MTFLLSYFSGMSYKQVHRDDSDISKIDLGIKNKFNWNWLVEKDKNGMFLSEWVRKLDGPGVALCNICNSILKYGSAGKSAFLRHVENSKDHNARVSATKNNTTLPLSYQIPGDGPTDVCTLPYGAAPNIHSDAQCNSRTEPVLPKIPSFKDRCAHNEAFVISFLAENNLPFTMAPKLLDFANHGKRF